MPGWHNHQMSTSGDACSTKTGMAVFTRWSGRMSLWKRLLFAWCHSSCQFVTFRWWMTPCLLLKTRCNVNVVGEEVKRMKGFTRKCMNLWRHKQMRLAFHPESRKVVAMDGRDKRFCVSASLCTLNKAAVNVRCWQTTSLRWSWSSGKRDVVKQRPNLIRLLQSMTCEKSELLSSDLARAG